MRHSFKIFTLFYFFAALTSNAQQKNIIIEDRLIGKNYFVNSFCVQITKEFINISENDGTFFNMSIDGDKYFLTSPSSNYFLITNYQFTKEKKDYPVTYLVFNNTGEKIFEHTITAPFDLPHPICAVTDQGTIALFDPLKFIVSLINSDDQQQVKLEKEMAFEMERASFISTYNNTVVVAASLKPVDISDNTPNVTLYKIDINNLQVIKTKLNFSIPTALYASENKIAVAGAIYNNSSIDNSLLLFSDDLTVLNEYNLPAEEIAFYNGALYTRYAGKIFKLENNKTLLYKFENGERVTNLLVNETGVQALVKGSAVFSLYNFNHNLNLNFYFNLNDFDSQKITEVFLEQGKYVLLQPDKTFIIN